MSSPKTQSPSKRADAQRNRAKILAAARSAFADPTAEVSMAEISRRAGLGMATLYRNFPGRRELLEALYNDEVNAVCEAAETIDADTPGAVLGAWLYRFFEFSRRAGVGMATLYRNLLKHTGGPTPFFSQNRDRVLAAGRPLLLAAQHAHEVRDDLTLEQILDMIIGIAGIRGDTSYVQPILQAALDGLRPSAAHGPEAKTPGPR
jgi:AcrR family transcriptional regulator